MQLSRHIDYVIQEIEFSTGPVEYEDLCMLEPQLTDLKTLTEKRVLDMIATGRIDPSGAWYGYREWHGQGIKAMMEKLVGWYAANKDLDSSEFYDIATQTLYYEILEAGTGS